MANSLFVDRSHAEDFTKIYDQWTGEPSDFEDLIYQKKKLILEISLASELQMLARRLDALAQSDRRTQDFTLNGLLHALREVIACFPVYRSYVTSRGVSETDIRQTELAVQQAIKRNPKSDPSAFRFVGDVVLLRSVLGAREDVVYFAGKFQQVTAPTTAKGIEDTAFYSYHRLFSLNEVGGEPQRFGVSPADLHRYFEDRQKRWPFAMSTLSTHDTKRSEDVRARINVLSEIPDEWYEHVTRWREQNAIHVTREGPNVSPAADEQYLLYQALLGAWPLKLEDADRPTFVKRIQAYMIKAMREAKIRTSWTQPNEQHEKAVTDFVAAILDQGKSAAFLEDFQPFQQRISHYGMINSLSQTLLKIAAPGVPDTYQGTELWDYSLVDPDNRRPVDYTMRARLLAELKAFEQSAGKAALAADVLRTPEDGRVKLLTVAASLAVQGEQPGLLSDGDYVPLNATGDFATNLFAFARVAGDSAAIINVPRLTTKLRMSPEGWPIGEQTWAGTSLALPPALHQRRWKNVVTGESLDSAASIAAAKLLSTFPVGFWCAA
jgi:(1->4)-alpha-D-glucan 1-alpha-D-glucosylmutase